MTAAILSLIATAAAILWWVVKWWLRKEANVLDQHRDRYAQIDKEMATQDSSAASLSGVSDLDELDRLQLHKGHKE